MCKKFLEHGLVFICIVFAFFIITGCSKEILPEPQQGIEVSINNKPITHPLLQDEDEIILDEEPTANEKDSTNLSVYDEKFPLRSFSGQVGVQVEFDFAEISMITLLPQFPTSAKTEEPIQLSETYTQYIRSNLNWLNLDLALVDAVAFVSQPIVITLYSSHDKYELKYDLNLNAYHIGGQYYYANHEVTELMHYLFKPNTALAKLEYYHLLQQAAYDKISENKDLSPMDESVRYPFESLLINDLEYNGWLKLIIDKAPSYPPIGQTDPTIFYTYESGIEQLVPIVINEEDNIILSDAIYFLGEQYETINGIKVGLSKDEVLEKLGTANLETETVWSYLIGDFLKFHLYFEDKIIKIISLTMPM